jgi:hypothetical protein
VFEKIRMWINNTLKREYEYRFCSLCQNHTTHENHQCMICSGQIEEEEKKYE